jgi:aminopeptidase N
MDVIQDLLLRQLLWTSLYDLTRDAKMKATDFLNLVSSKISIENDSKLLQTLITRASAVLSHFLPNAIFPAYSEKLFHSFFHELNKATEPDFKIIWARSVVEFAATESTVNVLAEQLRNNNPVFTQDLRWSMIHKLLAWGFPDAGEFLEKEKQKDISDTGARALLRAKTSVPDINEKRAAWERFIHPETKFSAHQSASEMSGFRWRHQESILEEFIEKFFQIISMIFKTREKEFANSFFIHLGPSNPENPKILHCAEQLLANLSPEEKHLRKALQESIDDIHRSIKCRNLIQN